MKRTTPVPVLLLLATALLIEGIEAYRWWHVAPPPTPQPLVRYWHWNVGCPNECRQIYAAWGWDTGSRSISDCCPNLEEEVH
jgi:hypothetical protein